MDEGRIKAESWNRVVLSYYDPLIILLKNERFMVCVT